MKKVISILLVVALITMSGCGFNKSKSNRSDSDGRIIYQYNDGFVLIVTDAETGVQYISRGSGGMCVMVDKNGMPYTGGTANG